MRVSHECMGRAVMAGAIALALAGPVHAEAIKVGLGTGGVGHLFVAQEKGYFAAEGLTVETWRCGALVGDSARQRPETEGSERSRAVT